MIKIVKNAISSAAHRAKGMGMRVKAAMLMACVALLKPVGVFAQSLANTGYDAGTSAMEEVATQIAAYVPYVVNLCYALAGVVAIVGAISVYIAMNNEEQDVKNILVLQNRQETRRKEMKLNSLLHNTLCRYLNFPIFENVVLKNI
jgi:hypothetical protein